MKSKVLIFLTVVALSLGWTTAGFCSGALKKTVAVFEFQNDSGYSSIATLGQDFSTQLSDALVQSGKFIVLTRKDLDVVMAEQDLAASDRMAKSNTAKIGKIVPAQILIKGQITEFEEDTSGGGQGLSIHGVSLGMKKSATHMAVIIQLIDSTTGEIIESKRVEGESTGGGVSLGYSGAIDINSSNFKKTPLGKVIQITIDQAVDYLSRKLSSLPWEGKVVTVKDGLVYVNSGTTAGVQTGNTFAVYKEGEALTDPDTGMNLGSERTKIADIKISEVQEKFSKAQITSGKAEEISKGDIVQE
ncbi:MAG TPA: CsgG/HfaB family protein [Candidatus Omnitrophota bacterium]|nr:CsgG/HfaB family protein [Candidatus Omnitrophota bacterium]HPD84726.1 CsgG/HfaB family protein [Candidatus Omnitrophota bacterium]HRZ03584.1 CsgG/HfaB family protein [Candidatus Omnitrophota bacterium]